MLQSAVHHNSHRIEIFVTQYFIASRPIDSGIHLKQLWLLIYIEFLLSELRNLINLMHMLHYKSFETATVTNSCTKCSSRSIFLYMKAHGFSILDKHIQMQSHTNTHKGSTSTQMKRGILEVLLVHAKGMKHTNLIGNSPSPIYI